jgi:hypothetical protein
VACHGLLHTTICQRADRLTNQLRDWVAAEGVVGLFIDEQCNSAAREDTADRWLKFELKAKALSVGALAQQPWEIGYHIPDTIQPTDPSPGRIGSRYGCNNISCTNLYLFQGTSVW